ncbi:hypothetical protein Mal48_08130 [Thalassoglobus polymorphus]|uniref:Uncharacterized protein n=2 Tax=Thalassoglobus polymorphus TaxID=2527994 RepID=A0A517QIW0_9PLAN|nr:hypothetical protein Mal48_08130 [Thalassoglobus polymorphus]
MLVGLFIGFMQLPVPAYAQGSDPDLLVVAETGWGFDGRVKVQEFVPLWVQVKNISSTPWQGELQLSRKMRGERQFGATIVQNVSLQGDEIRWIQLSPYVVDDYEDWVLRWGPGKNHVIDLPPVLKGEPPTVLVYDSDAVLQETTVFRRMPEERFPTSVTSTDSLRGIILDQPPFWQGARARAFQDWLILGGRVYILHNRDGKYPVFPMALAFLNSEQTQFRVGSGYVRKIPRKAESFSMTQASSEIFNDDWTSEDEKLRKEMLNTGANQYSPYGGLNLSWSKNQDLFRELMELAKFERFWPLIYLSVFAYLATLWPGCYIIGTQQKNVTRFYALFFAATGFFALTFGLLGQVGGRAENRSRSVLLARSLGEGSFDVTGWTVLANIYSGEKGVSHAGNGIFYSTTQETEYVPGELHSGTGGVASFEMLPDTKRTLLHRARVRTVLPNPKMLGSGDEDLKLQSLSFDITGAFDEEPIFALAIIRGNVYELDIQQNLLEFDRRRQPTVLTQYLQKPIDFNMNFNMWGVPRPADEDETEDEKLIGLEQYRSLIRPMIGNSFGFGREIDLRKLKSHSSGVRLYVLTKTPANFEFDSKDFPDREGVVLFSYDYP